MNWDGLEWIGMDWDELGWIGMEMRLVGAILGCDPHRSKMDRLD